jgi:hypothetical protein
MTEANAIIFQVVGLIVALTILGLVVLRRRWLERQAQTADNVSSSPTPATKPHPLADGRRWILVGPPGSGKSTAARGLIRVLMGTGAKVMIIDPDGSAWPAGAAMIGSPDDYEAISAKLGEVMELATKRRAAFQRGERLFSPILIVIDEVPIILRNTPGAIEQVADLARRGRKLGISVILLSQDTQARTLGIEGQTKLLDAFEKFETKMTPAGVQLVDSAGAIRTTIPLDTNARDLVLPVVEVTPEPVVEARQLERVSGRPATPDADRLLERVLREPVPESNGGQISAVLAPPVGTSSQAADLVPADTHAVPGGFDDEVIKALAEAGWSRNKIAAKLGGRRTDALARVRSALGE